MGGQHQPLTGRLADLLVPAMAWSILAAATSQPWRSPRDASLLIGAAAAGLAWLFGVSDFSWLFASQLPTGLAPVIARSAIVVALGLGFALAANGALEARERLTAPRPDAPSSPAAGPTPAGDAHRGHRRVLLVLLAVVAIAFVLASAPLR